MWKHFVSEESQKLFLISVNIMDGDSGKAHIDIGSNFFYKKGSVCLQFVYVGVFIPCFIHFWRSRILKNRQQ